MTCSKNRNMNGSQASKESKGFLGRLFIRVYYYISPKLVVVLKGHEAINKVIRNILDKQVQRIIERKIDKE